MSNKTTLTCFLKEKKHTYNILDKIQVEIDITYNPYGLHIDHLFSMAARKNKKRAFLFVSKILGKHIPVSPRLSLLGGALLAARCIEEIYNEKHTLLNEIVGAFEDKNATNHLLSKLKENKYSLPKETLFIGFAETATALGHAMFTHFENAHFVHTTREQVQGLTSCIHFEEEHSHATSQRCYIDPMYLQSDHPVVLVDDEITTGKTALNIIRSIQSVYQRKEYIVVSLLDWRSDEDRIKYKLMEDELDISIKVVALIAGHISVQGSPIVEERIPSLEPSDPCNAPTVSYYSSEDFGCVPNFIEYSTIDSNELTNPSPFLKLTGRFGISSHHTVELDSYAKAIAEGLKKTVKGNKILCLGTGEFMYIPMKIASYLGEDVLYQSTTRSPIHRDNSDRYAIKMGFSYPSPEDPSELNYSYNIPYREYNDIVLFMERDCLANRMEPLLTKLAEVGANHIHVIQCSH